MNDCTIYSTYKSHKKVICAGKSSMHDKCKKCKLYEPEIDYNAEEGAVKDE